MLTFYESNLTEESHGKTTKVTFVAAAAAKLLYVFQVSSARD